MTSGAALRDDGMNRAYQHALDFNSNWGENAFNVLLAFIAQTRKPTFLTEEVRFWSVGKLTPPPHQRSWGAVIIRAAKAGKVIKDGYGMCKDPGQHRTPATLWRIVK